MRRSIHSAWIYGFTLGSIVTSCAQRFPSVPNVSPADETMFGRSEVVLPSGMDDQHPGAFQLRPGDIVRVRTISLDPLDIDQSIVDEQGLLGVPLAGNVSVVGLTIDLAANRIEQAIHRYDRFARVVITITNAAGHAASVVGAVEHAGAFPLTPNTRVADLLALAGGPKVQTTDGELTDLADLSAATLVRNGVTLPISFRAALTGDPRHNVHALPNDLLYVPALHGQQISVLGQVRTARSIPFRSGIRLMQALAMAGGPNENANSGDIRVIRGQLSSPRIYQAAVNAIIDGQSPDVLLQPGDVVFVTEHWLATVSQVVNRLTPMLAASAVALSFFH